MCGALLTAGAALSGCEYAGVVEESDRDSEDLEANLEGGDAGTCTPASTSTPSTTTSRGWASWFRRRRTQPSTQTGQTQCKPTGSSPGTPVATDTPADPGALLPARVRRLSNAEFDTSVKALLGVDSKFGASFTPDTRQDGFTRNDAQRVDPVFITQLSEAADKVAESARSRLGQLAPCQDAAGSEACARTFIESFAKRAYRRPVQTREVDALLSVYRAAAEGATYADGIQTTISAVLQSPGFLYLTELGNAGSATLTQYELASALSYLLTGAPPDDALLSVAAQGQLGQSEVRQREARRLLATPAASQQIIRLIEEWLGIDRIGDTAKDSNVYPEFAGLRDAMKREADSFVSEVMWKSGGSVSDLLAADWTTAEDGLARMYLNGQAPSRSGNRVSLSGVRRRGILNQGAFLSVYAHATETAPVLRGVALLRRLACIDIPAPTSLQLNIVPPVPDPAKTTRERFEVHARDPVCASCHKSIDPIGFSFENLDGMGKERKTENGRPVDSKTTLQIGQSFDGTYADSVDLVTKLAQSPELKACFARHMFRYAAARSDASAQGAESAFMTSAQALPASAQGKVNEVLLAYVGSSAFMQRGAGR